MRNLRDAPAPPRVGARTHSQTSTNFLSPRDNDANGLLFGPPKFSNGSFYSPYEGGLSPSGAAGGGAITTASTHLRLSPGAPTELASAPYTGNNSTVMGVRGDRASLDSHSTMTDVSFAFAHSHPKQQQQQQPQQQQQHVPNEDGKPQQMFLSGSCEQVSATTSRDTSTPVSPIPASTFSVQRTSGRRTFSGTMSRPSGPHEGNERRGNSSFSSARGRLGVGGGFSGPARAGTSPNSPALPLYTSSGYLTSPFQPQQPPQPQQPTAPIARDSREVSDVSRSSAHPAQAANLSTTADIGSPNPTVATVRPGRGLKHSPSSVVLLPVNPLDPTTTPAGASGSFSANPSLAHGRADQGYGSIPAPPPVTSILKWPSGGKYDTSLSLSLQSSSPSQSKTTSNPHHAVSNNSSSDSPHQGTARGAPEAAGRDVRPVGMAEEGALATPSFSARGTSGQWVSSGRAVTPIAEGLLSGVAASPAPTLDMLEGVNGTADVGSATSRTVSHRPATLRGDDAGLGVVPGTSAGATPTSAASVPRLQNGVAERTKMDGSATSATAATTTSPGHARPAPLPTLLAGRKGADRFLNVKLDKGRFVVQTQIGNGSFGELFWGVDLWSGREVAIKLEPAKVRQPQLLFESRLYKHLHSLSASYHPSITRCDLQRFVTSNTLLHVGNPPDRPAPPPPQPHGLATPPALSLSTSTSVTQHTAAGLLSSTHGPAALSHTQHAFAPGGHNLGDPLAGSTDGALVAVGPGLSTVSSTSHGSANQHQTSQRHAQAGGSGSTDDRHGVDRRTADTNNSNHNNSVIGGGSNVTFATMAAVVGIPRCYYCGQEGDYHVLVMDLLGPNLEDLFNYCGRRFSIKTVCMLADQMLHRLEYLHHKGFIHRDLKPENFVMGRSRTSRCAEEEGTSPHAGGGGRLGDDALLGSGSDGGAEGGGDRGDPSSMGHVVYLIDYGLAKRFWDARLNAHVPYKEGKSLTGTVRYCSVSAHLGVEQSRRDDLESLGYILMYFLRKGSLPWQGIRTGGGGGGGGAAAGGGGNGNGATNLGMGGPILNNHTNNLGGGGAGAGGGGGCDAHAKNMRISEKKIHTPLEVLCHGLPSQMYKYMKYVRGLKFDEAPNYSACRELFAQMLERHGGYDARHDWVFDWTVKREKERARESAARRTQEKLRRKAQLEKEAREQSVHTQQQLQEKTAAMHQTHSLTGAPVEDDPLLSYQRRHGHHTVPLLNDVHDDIHVNVDENESNNGHDSDLVTAAEAVVPSEHIFVTPSPSTANTPSHHHTHRPHATTPPQRPSSQTTPGGPERNPILGLGDVSDTTMGNSYLPQHAPSTFASVQPMPSVPTVNFLSSVADSAVAPTSSMTPAGNPHSTPPASSIQQLPSAQHSVTRQPQTFHGLSSTPDRRASPRLTTVVVEDAARREGGNHFHTVRDHFGSGGGGLVTRGGGSATFASARDGSVARDGTSTYDFRSITGGDTSRGALPSSSLARESLTATSTTARSATSAGAFSSAALPAELMNHPSSTDFLVAVSSSSSASAEARGVRGVGHLH